MTQDEIIDMVRCSGLGMLLEVGGMDKCLEHFSKLVAEKAIKEALAKLEQKYHRGDRLICLETEEYCVIHISGTDRQWVKFPDSHIGVYTNEQVAELFELLPKEPDQEPMAWMDKDGDVLSASVVNGKGLRNIPLYTTPPQRKPLLDEFGYWWFEYGSGLFPLEGEDQEEHAYRVATAAWQAAHGIKGD